MFLILSLACALHTTQTGLVQVHDDRVELCDSAGGVWSLTGDPVLPLLDGCMVAVEGARVARRLVVSDWRVTDAGDGSEPYVGHLRRYGSHWMIRDRNSGAELRLHAPPEALAAHADELVLLVGYVVGSHELSVVWWRALETEEDAP